MEEAEAYVQRGRELYGASLTEIIATIDPSELDMIDIEYTVGISCGSALGTFSSGGLPTVWNGLSISNGTGKIRFGIFAFPLQDS